jgi:hypothetical protein
MRELTQNEINSTAGGFNCIDKATMQNLQSKALNDGIIIAVLGSALIGSATYLAAGPYIAVMTGLAVAPYIAGFGYFNSSAWVLL